MNKNIFASILVSILLGLFSLGLGGCAREAIEFPGAEVPGPDAAMFVPKQAPIMVSLLANPDKLEDFLEQTTGSERGKLRREFKEIKKGLLADTGLDYKHDIQAWLGDEITFAVTSLDIDRDRSNGEQPGYLVAIATESPELSREFLEHLWENKPLTGDQLQLENYAGVQLVYARTGPGAGELSPLADNWASALVGDSFVLFANHPKVLRDAINNVQAPNLNLNNNETYASAIAELKTNLGLTFVNLPQFNSWLNKRKDGSHGKSNPSLFPVTIGLGIAPVAPQGLVAQTVWQGAGIEGIPSLKSPVKALQYLPESVSAFAAGADLKDLWANFSDSLSEENVIGGLLGQKLANLDSRWGINLPEDIFSWAQGEYALGWLSDSDWIFVAGSTGESDEVGKKLDAIATERGLSAGEIALGDLSLYAWTKLITSPSNASGETVLKPRVEGVRGSVGEYEIFASSVAAMEKAIAAPEAGSVLANEEFQQAIASLKSPNYGHLYLDWKQVRRSLERQFPFLQLVELAAQPIFEHLRSLTLSSFGLEDGYNRADIFIRLKT
ncbi:MAG: DUF3352 domain-containing protein [Oscillatoria sp. SIO1A7]|nr:DUF3352 domain-containing protein [Oscillatoria sp. SIO1A7]